MAAKNGHIVTDATRAKISKAHLGKHIPKEQIERYKNSMKKYYNDPNYLKKMSQVAKKQFANPESRYLVGLRSKKMWENPDYREKMRAIHKNRFSSPKARKEHGDRIRKHYVDHPEDRVKQSKAHKKLYIENPEIRRKNSEGHKKYYKQPGSREKNKETLKKHHRDHPETRKKLSEAQKRYHSDRYWYGGVSYLEPYKYCALFNNEFRNRCRSFDGYKSVLSGIKEEDHIVKGKQRKLVVHHVYYQKKACCEWDEDTEGYYVMLNLGTKRKPNIVRYNIKGDPNKFVTLTLAENTMVNSDKLKWIKIFEDMIEARGGKCYYTQEEMNTMMTKSNSQSGGVLV